MSPDRLPAHRRQRRRLHGRRRTSCAASRLRHPAWRQRLRQRRHPSASRERRRHAEHSAQRQSQMEELLLALPLSQPQRHRTHVLPIEGLQARRHALRPKRSELPRSMLCGRETIVTSGQNSANANAILSHPSVIRSSTRGSQLYKSASNRDPLCWSGIRKSDPSQQIARRPIAIFASNGEEVLERC